MVMFTLDNHITSTPCDHYAFAPLRCRPLPSPPYRIQGVGFMLLLDSCLAHGSARDDDGSHRLSHPNQPSSLFLASHFPLPSFSFLVLALSRETCVFLAGPGCTCQDTVSGGGSNGRRGERSDECRNRASGGRS